MLIQIKNWNTGDIIFELDKKYNTIKDTVEEAVRRYISLHGADLHEADLHGADLCGADLRNADLSYADLNNADLPGANLSGADLEYANLECSDLSVANLCYTNLICANLYGANVKGTLFGEAAFGETILPDFPMACPETGSFVAYKKIVRTKEYGIHRAFIVKLEIPEDAIRSSATTNKCRCSKAKVLEIKDIDSGEPIEEITNTNMIRCVYKVGEMVYPDGFDKYRWNECSRGIHFFMTEEEAINYK